MLRRYNVRIHYKTLSRLFAMSGAVTSYIQPRTDIPLKLIVNV